MAKPIWERKPEKMLSTEARSWLAELQEEWNGLQEKAEKLETLTEHMKSAPDRVPRDNWLRPTKSFLLQVLDWIIAHRKILEAEG